jgi:hypothetical protein
MRFRTRLTIRGRKDPFVQRGISRSAAVLALLAAVILSGGSVTAAEASSRSATSTTRTTTTGEIGVLATCPSGFACFWGWENFVSSRGAVAGNNPNFSAFSSSSSGCFGTWDNCIRSIRNSGTACTVYFWTGAGYTGRAHSLSRGDEVANFASAPPAGYNDAAFNDSISSNHWCTPR